MGGPNEDQCQNLIFTGATPVGDADISGIGVVLAFILSAYVTFAVVFLAYAFGMIEPEMLNMADTRVFRVRPYRGQAPQTHAAIRKAVLSLSDQQIVTGIAIMGAGFQGVRTGNISVYHFQIVLYLAWMSSSVHLSCLTLLRPFLMDHLGVKAWRLVGMLILLVLLIVGIIPTISNDWGLIVAYNEDDIEVGKSCWGLPASCFWSKTYGDGVNSDAILGWVILGCSYIWKVGDLFTISRDFYFRWFADPADRAAQATLLYAAKRYEASRQTRWLFLFQTLLISYLPFAAIFEVAASYSASLWLSALGLIFGTMQIQIPRSQNIEFTGPQENTWGFGQLTPLILLVQPLGAVTEVFWVRNRRNSVEALDEADWNLPFQTPPVTHNSDAENPKHLPFIRVICSLDQLRKDELAGNEGFQAQERAREEHTRELQDYLYSSLLFKAHVISIHLGIALIAILVYYNDAIAIGYYAPKSWGIVAKGIGSYLAAVILLTIVFIPFSRLGKPLKRDSSRSRHWPVEMEMRIPGIRRRRQNDNHPEGQADDEAISPLRKGRTNTSLTSRPDTSSS